MWRRLIALCLAWVWLCGAYIQWDASVVDETHDAPDGYRVYYGTASDQLTTTYDVGTALRFDVPESWPANTYYFGVKAYNAYGESGWATTDTWQTWVAYTKSDPPIEPPSPATDVRVVWEQIEEPPIMALSKVQNDPATSATTTLSFSISDAATGNLLLAFVTVSLYGETRTATPPTGWSTLTGPVDNGNVRGYIFYKIADSGDGTTYNFTLSASDWASGVIYEITEFNSSDIFNGYTLASETNGSSIVANSVTPDVLGCLALAVLFDDNAPAPWNVSSGWTKDAEAIPNYHATRTALRDELTSDTTTAITNTFSGTWAFDSPVAGVVLINPSASAAVPVFRGNRGMMVGMSNGMWFESDWLKPTGGN